MKKIALKREQIYQGNLILVNPQYAYCETAKRKIPDLVNVCDNISHIDKKGQEMLLRTETADMLDAVMERLNGWSQMAAVSGWRSLKEQQTIWDDSVRESGMEFTGKYVAVPGHSEHQTGLAIDLGLKQEEIDFICPEFPYEGICQVFRETAPQYGFVERYPKGKEGITGIGHEPWHFRYVGIPHAEIMRENGMVLEEYILFLRNYVYGKNPYEICMEKSGEQIGNQGTTDHDRAKTSGKIRISYQQAALFEDTVIETDEKTEFSISGNNIDGFIITEWEKAEQ